MANYDNAELLTDIRVRGGIPSADIRFTDAKLLATANVELRDVVFPLLVDTQTERGVYLSDVTVTSGTAEYRLPSRASGARFKSVGWRTPGSSTFKRLRHLSADSYYLQNLTEGGEPYGFFLRDTSLVLVPTPNTAGTLRVPYYLRPNTLVLPAAAGVVLSTGASTITMTGTVSGFTSGATYDVVRGTPGFETLVLGVTATVAGAVLTFSSPLPTNYFAPVAGDYVCLSGQSPVAQCPVEVRGLLGVRAARRALKAVNEGQQAAMLDADVTELEAVARSLLAPRADAEPQEWGDPRRGLLMGTLY